VEHPDARWLSDPSVWDEVERREDALTKIGDELDAHENCPLTEHPDSGCKLPEAHQCTGAGLSIHAALVLGEVYVAAKAWAEWRQGQCDWPKGANPEEVLLVDVIRDALEPDRSPGGRRT
jgi:hypothetical protein